MDATTENLGNLTIAADEPRQATPPPTSDAPASAQSPAATAYPIWVPHPPRTPSPWENDPRYHAERPKLNPKLHAEQSIRIARFALDYYIEATKTNFELLEVRPVNYVPTECRPYIHINFVARATEQGSHGLLFFAEMYLCGKRRTPSGYSMTYCEPLGDYFTTGRKGVDRPRADPSVTKEKIDLTYCYACDQNMLHPEGTKYVGGHCNVPGIYNGVAML